MSTGLAPAYLLLVDSADASHGLSQLFLLPHEYDLSAVDAGGRDVNTCTGLLHDLTHQFVVGPGNEGVEGLFHLQPLHGTLVLGRQGGQEGLGAVKDRSVQGASMQEGLGLMRTQQRG